MVFIFIYLIKVDCITKTIWTIWWTGQVTLFMIMLKKRLWDDGMMRRSDCRNELRSPFIIKGWDFLVSSIICDVYNLYTLKLQSSSFMFLIHKNYYGDFQGNKFTTIKYLSRINLFNIFGIETLSLSYYFYLLLVIVLYFRTT